MCARKLTTFGARKNQQLMPTYTGKYTLEYECTIQAPDNKAAYQELNRFIGLKNQQGKVLSIIRTDMPANHVCDACEAEKRQKLEDALDLRPL